MLRVIRTSDDVTDFASWLSVQRYIALDTETTGHPIFHPDFEVRTVQIGSPTVAWIIEFDRWPGLVADVLARYPGRFVWHNLGYDAAALERQGMTIDWSRCDDTMIALRLAEPGESAKLKEAAVRHISPTAAQPQTDLHKAMKSQGWTWATVPLEFEGFQRYAGLDPILTAGLYETETVKRGLASVVYPLEMQVRNICNRIEAGGIRVDEEHCRRLHHLYARDAEAIKTAVEDEFKFSITSNDQLADWLLATDARHHMMKVTPGGKPSVDQEVLEAIVAAGNPGVDAWAAVAADTLTVRKLDKYRAAYLEHFLEPSVDGLIHAQIETLAARTGRMSVRNPPLHQLPAPNTADAMSYDIRRAVIPRADDQVLLCADYNQIELRAAAVDSDDPGLIEAFRVADESGLDFFTASARDIYGEPGFARSDPRRQPIKSYWYSVLYGAGADTQAHTAGVTPERINEIREAVAERYPKFTKLMLQHVGMVRDSGGWIDTPYGRQLSVPPGKLYVATNYRIQGWAADIMKRALVAMGHAGLEDMILMVVHDEVVLSVPEQDADEVAHVVQASMEDLDHAVPFTTGQPVRSSTWADSK